MILLPVDEKLSEKSHPKKGGVYQHFRCFMWWRRRESNPRPQVLRLWLYMLIRSIYLIAGYPTGRENRQRAWQGFNESAPGALHRDPISGDSRDPVVWARNRAEGFTQVFKLLKRSCRRWQLKFCNQFYELFAARHAPRVSLPTSKPGRPQVRSFEPGYLTSMRGVLPQQCITRNLAGLDHCFANSSPLAGICRMNDFHHS